MVTEIEESSEAMMCSSLHCIVIWLQFSTLWCTSRGALVGSGYGTPYGGQDMAGGEKQCRVGGGAGEAGGEGMEDET